MQYFVYIHTCPNGKKYVGVTTQSNPEYRWREGKGYKRNTYFYRAIKKYGWDNIEHEVFETHSLDLMAYWEKLLIYYYNTTNPEFGYNNTSGGEHINGCQRLDATKQKISKSLKGHIVSEETKKKISKAKKGFKHSEETKKKLREYKHSEETKKKISEAGKGRIPWNKGLKKEVQRPPLLS